ncbi:hypothetical protein AXG93_3384s1940 [Marchantia polymorpha subsp. ruderalis]|uniref:Uncharacterized protein n=1 Tax=Marchantia polymorpha subsp. ruderalis TaxID=1480154 RepID=A0A176WF57_MARPO|nr:hypothetical protein AXG93_3384s1940 [Marchantia polymorpha subsp. ruderalis]
MAHGVGHSGDAGECPTQSRGYPPRISVGSTSAKFLGDFRELDGKNGGPMLHFKDGSRQLVFPAALLTEKRRGDTSVQRPAKPGPQLGKPGAECGEIQGILSDSCRRLPRAWDLDSGDIVTGVFAVASALEVEVASSLGDVPAAGTETTFGVTTRYFWFIQVSAAASSRSSCIGFLLPSLLHETESATVVAGFGLKRFGHWSVSSKGCRILLLFTRLRYPERHSDCCKGFLLGFQRPLEEVGRGGGRGGKTPSRRGASNASAGGGYSGGKTSGPARRQTNRTSARPNPYATAKASKRHSLMHLLIGNARQRVERSFPCG